MELSEYTEALRREVSAVTRFAGEDVARAGQLIAETLDSSIRLTLLDVLAGAAAEITSRLDDTVIELRLSSANPTFAIIHATQSPPSPPVPPSPPAGAEEESGTSRVTLRLPDGLKSRAEAAAAVDGVSLNTWLVRAASQALGEPRSSRATPPSPPGPGRRITGYARS
ncbi:MAG TPA: toxin-antitoxin system HicB family antitoxin [Streptosporangiaceae bacterium]